jgi:hypothetical protein
MRFATPNGKDPSDDRDPSSGITTLGRQTPLSRRHFARDPRPASARRSPAAVTQLASSRLSINTCRPPRTARGGGNLGFFSPRPGPSFHFPVRGGWWR